jgi:hypothetical protein
MYNSSMYGLAFVNLIHGVVELGVNSKIKNKT